MKHEYSADESLPDDRFGAVAIRFIRLPIAIVAIALASCVISPNGLNTPSGEGTMPTAPAQTPDSQRSVPDGNLKWETWKTSISQVPIPKAGCFDASPPDPQWREVPCATERPQPRMANQSRGAGRVLRRRSVVAQSTAHIHLATGSFDSVSNATQVVSNFPNVTNPLNGGGSDEFSLQLNTNDFGITSPSLCLGTGPPVCAGLVHFQYWNDGSSGNFNSLVIEYWLPYAPSCPWGWQLQPGGCLQSVARSNIPNQTIADLASLSLRAGPDAHGNDGVMLITTNGAYAFANPSVFDLTTAWTEAEFNVFGFCCSLEAYFNTGSTLVVRVDIQDGASSPPSCQINTTTTETNNLTSVGCCSIGHSYGGGAIVFTESNATPPPLSACACPMGSSWNPTSGNCECGLPGMVIINGQCSPPLNACGKPVGTPCCIGESCLHQ